MGGTPPAVDLASLAGTWTLRTKPDGRDTVITSEIVATGTTEGPFPSVLRKGKMVTTSAVYHVQDGKLVGTLVARYDGAGADSVITGEQEATRQ
jgi:hypothetical protein